MLRQFNQDTARVSRHGLGPFKNSARICCGARDVDRLVLVAERHDLSASRRITSSNRPLRLIHASLTAYLGGRAQLVRRAVTAGNARPVLARLGQRLPRLRSIAILECALLAAPWLNEVTSVTCGTHNISTALTQMAGAALARFTGRFVHEDRGSCVAISFVRFRIVHALL